MPKQIGKQPPQNRTTLRIIINSTLAKTDRKTIPPKHIEQLYESQSIQPLPKEFRETIPQINNAPNIYCRKNNSTNDNQFHPIAKENNPPKLLLSRTTLWIKINTTPCQKRRKSPQKKTSVFTLLSPKNNSIQFVHISVMCHEVKASCCPCQRNNEPNRHVTKNINRPRAS